MVAILVMLALLVASVVITLMQQALGISRQEAWLIDLILFAIILVAAGYGIKRRWDGVFIDRDNRISLSRFQLIIWTTVLVSALFAAGLSNVLFSTNPPLAISIPEQIWALLGLGAFTAVAAPAIKDGKRGGSAEANRTAAIESAEAQRDAIAVSVQQEQDLKAPAQFDGHVLTKANSVDARWIDLIMGDYEGAAYVDISKLQKLAFTVLLVTVYGAGLWTVMAQSGFIGEFPPVDNGFLALLAISHAAYLADKQIAST